MHLDFNGENLPQKFNTFNFNFNFSFNFKKFKRKVLLING